MNNIFSKNISALMQKNPNLAKELVGYLPTEIPKLVQENNTYNFIYKNTYVHNIQNPLGEAIEIFSMAQNTPVSIHLVYGIGLGYLFQVTSQQSKGTVILYEPDLNILRIAFSLVDFSNDLLKRNVYIVNNLKSASEAIYKHSNTKNSPELLSLPSQRRYDPEGFDELVKTLQKIIGSFSLDLKYTKQNFYPSLKLLIKNIPSLLTETPINRLKDLYKGKTAVVCSAGPTLDRNIDTLKKYRENYVLFVVGTAAKTLYKQGLKPDFLCIIESYNSSKQIEGIDLSDVCFITEPYSHPDFRKYKFKKTFSHISANTPINHFWADITGENIEEYWSKGTVSYTALNCARLLGCSKIIVVGQDLAYIEGQCYSKDSAYKDLICGINPETNNWEIMAKDFKKFSDAISAHPDQKTRENTAKNRLKNLNKSLYTVRGIKGNLLPTESVYAAFINPLTEYTEKFNDRIYINTSLVGAQIDGFENMELEKALENSQPIEKKIPNIEFTYDKNLIKNNLLKSLELLKTSIITINSGKNLLKSLNNDLKRSRELNVELLKKLKALSTNYTNLSENMTKQSKLYDFITIAEKIDLDYEMKMTQHITFDSVKQISNLLSIYYNNTEKKINEIERLINESINTTC